MLDELFHGLMARIDNVNELKVTLFCLWAFEQRDEPNGLYWLRRADFDGLNAEVHGMDEDAIDDGLDCAVLRETLFCAKLDSPNSYETVYLWNTPAAKAALESVNFSARLDASGQIDILPPRPSVYKVYEENIGPLTGLIGDDLHDLVKEYTEDWVRDAIKSSVTQEKRSIAYIKGVLRKRMKEGKYHAETGRHSTPDEKSATGKYADFFKR